MGNPLTRCTSTTKEESKMKDDKKSAIPIDTVDKNTSRRSFIKSAAAVGGTAILDRKSVV